MSIFKAYDIRGRYPDEINEEKAYAIGRAFVTFTKTTDIMLGLDARTHSPTLANAFIKGALEQGADVTVVGLVTTSQFIAMRSWHNHDTAVIVTASHLDAPFNGFKMLTGTGQYISENYGMRELERLATTATFSKPARTGTQREADYGDDYAQHITALAHITRPLAGIFVADASSGTIGKELHTYQKTILPNLVVLNDTPDGTFPAHSPNPIAPGAAKQAIEAVQKHHASGGCIFDADADRVTFLDEKGKEIHPNHLSCLLIHDALAREPGNAVAYDLISSRVVPETITAAGGKALRTKVGRANVIDSMMHTQAILGVESSSHMMLKETLYGEAVGLFMLRVIQIIEREQKPLSVLIAPYIRYALIPERNYTVANPEDVMKALESAFPEAKKDYLDGVALEFPDGWIVLRKSNTEPLLRFRAEANTQARADEFIARAEAVIHAHGGVLQTGGH